MSRSTRGQLLLLASGHKVAVNKLSGLPNPQLSSLSKDAEEQHVWAPGTVGARADTRAVDEKPAVELPPELVLLKKMFEGLMQGRGFLKRRREKVTHGSVRETVERYTRREFRLEHLAQMKYLYNDGFDWQWIQVKVDDARKFEHQLLLTFERPLASGDSVAASGGGGRVNETAECAAFFARVDAYVARHVAAEGSVPPVPQADLPSKDTAQVLPGSATRSGQGARSTLAADSPTASLRSAASGPLSPIAVGRAAGPMGLPPRSASKATPAVSQRGLLAQQEVSSMRKPRSPTQRSLFDYVQHAKPGTPSVGTATKQAGAGHLARSAAGTPTGAKPPGAAGVVLASSQAHIAAGRAASLDSPTGRAPTGLMQQPSVRGDGLGTPHSHARGGAVAVGGQMPVLGHAGSSAASIATSPSTTRAAGSKAAYVMGLLSPAAREQLLRNAEAAAACTPEAKAAQAFRSAVTNLPSAHDLVRSVFGPGGPCVRPVQEVAAGMVSRCRDRAGLSMRDAVNMLNALARAAPEFLKVEAACILADNSYRAQSIRIERSVVINPLVAKLRTIAADAERQVHILFGPQPLLAGYVQPGSATPTASQHVASAPAQAGQVGLSAAPVAVAGAVQVSVPEADADCREVDGQMVLDDEQAEAAVLSSAGAVAGAQTGAAAAGATGAAGASQQASLPADLSGARETMTQDQADTSHQAVLTDGKAVADSLHAEATTAAATAAAAAAGACANLVSMPPSAPRDAGTMAGGRGRGPTPATAPDAPRPCLPSPLASPIRHAARAGRRGADGAQAGEAGAGGEHDGHGPSFTRSTTTPSKAVPTAAVGAGAVGSCGAVGASPDRAAAGIVSVAGMAGAGMASMAAGAPPGMGLPPLHGTPRRTAVHGEVIRCSSAKKRDAGSLLERLHPQQVQQAVPGQALAVEAAAAGAAAGTTPLMGSSTAAKLKRRKLDLDAVAEDEQAGAGAVGGPKEGQEASMEVVGAAVVATRRKMERDCLSGTGRRCGPAAAAAAQGQPGSAAGCIGSGVKVRRSSRRSSHADVLPQEQAPVLQAEASGSGGVQDVCMSASDAEVLALKSAHGAASAAAGDEAAACPRRSMSALAAAAAAPHVH